jgi:uncharacterized protein
VTVARRPLVLLPPSKGKAPDGGAPSFGSALRRRHPLAAARRTVAEAVEAAVPTLDTASLARLTGTPADKAEAERAVLADLGRLPTLPAHRRYTGVVHGNAGLASIDPAAAAVDIRIVSGLLGLVGMDEPVPPYRLEVAASVPGLGGLATFWRGHLGVHLRAIAGDVPVWNLLPGEHERALPAVVLRELDLITVRFVRPDGRAANAARTKVAKGRLAAFLLAAPAATPRDAAADADLGPGWTLVADGAALVATFHG